MTDDSTGCGYSGHEFGASYPDSLCVDGFLWDADSGDEGMLTTGGDLPCPHCNTVAFLAAAREDAEESLYGIAMFTPWCAAIVWEAAVAKALSENPSVARDWLAQQQPFDLTDWPDRQAVYERRARYDHTVQTTWRYQPLPPPPEPT